MSLSTGPEKKGWTKRGWIEPLIWGAVVLISFPLAFYMTTAYYRIVDEIK
jgi:hypothetical protein